MLMEVRVMARELRARPRAGLQALYSQNHESRSWPGGNKVGLLRPRLIADWMKKQTEAGDLPGKEGAVGLQLQQKEEDNEVLFPECQLSKLMSSSFPHLYTLNPLSTSRHRNRSRHCSSRS